MSRFPETDEVKRLDASVRIACLACLTTLLMIGANPLATAEELSSLTAEQATAAARRNAMLGNSITILWKVRANGDTQRVGDEALEQALAHKIERYQNGRLVDVLRSGSYLLAEIDPRTNNVVATHFVLLEAGGTVKDVESKCHGAVKLADAEEVVKDTAELIKQMYSTPSIEESSLAGKFYGGNFPDGDQFPDDLFTIPAFLRKPGAKANEVREAAALFWGYGMWISRSALAKPAFAVNPAAAGEAAEKERDLLKAKFLLSKNVDPNSNPVDFDNVRSEQQFQRRIALLKELNRFLEDSLKREADPVVIGANLSIIMMPLSVDVHPNQAGQYVSSSPPNALFTWHRAATGGFAVEEITWDNP